MEYDIKCLTLTGIGTDGSTRCHPSRKLRWGTSSCGSTTPIRGCSVTGWKLQHAPRLIPAAPSSLEQGV